MASTASARLTVMKFGGSSVQSASRIRRVSSIIIESQPQRPCVVLSALGSTTDDILSIIHNALNNNNNNNHQHDKNNLKRTENSSCRIIDGCVNNTAETENATGTNTAETENATGTNTAETKNATGANTAETKNATGANTAETKNATGTNTADETCKLYGGVDSLKRRHLDIARELEVEREVGDEISLLCDEIEKLARGISLVQELTPRTRDLVLSYGERLSVRIVAAYLRKCGIAACAVDAWDAGVTTTCCSSVSCSEKSSVEIIPDSYEKIKTFFAPLANVYSYTPIITGFIARDTQGRVTTLGRGGSDFTAAIIGAGIGAREIEIWTDVDGVLSADPRVVSKPRCISTLRFEEAAELAYFGAKVLHPRTIAPAMKQCIPVRVKNSYSPRHPGTVIVAEFDRPVGHFVTAITFKRNVTIVDVVSTHMLGSPGFLSRLFAVFDEIQLSVDVVATSEVSVSVTLDDELDDDKAETLASKLQVFATVGICRQRAILSIIGNTNRAAEILATTCEFFKQKGIPLLMLSCGASKVNLTLAMPDALVEAAVKGLHDLFFPPGIASEPGARMKSDDVPVEVDGIATAPTSSPQSPCEELC